MKVGPEMAVRTQDHLVAGEAVKQVERYFVAVVDTDAIDPARASQPDNICAWQWSSLPEMQVTVQTIYPLGLANLVLEFLRSGPPATPIELSGWDSVRPGRQRSGLGRCRRPTHITDEGVDLSPALGDLDRRRQAAWALRRRSSAYASFRGTEAPTRAVGVALTYRPKATTQFI